MRWFPVILLIGLTVCLQTTVARRLALFDVGPDWLLVLVVFLAFYAPPREAAILGFVIGLTADLMTIERLGLVAFSYLCVAVGVGAMRDSLFRHERSTQFLVVLFACFLVRLGWLVYCRVAYDPVQTLGSMFAKNVLLVSIYTALWAPVWHSVLFRLLRVLGIPRPRYTFAT